MIPLDMFSCWFSASVVSNALGCPPTVGRTLILSMKVVTILEDKIGAAAVFKIYIMMGCCINEMKCNEMKIMRVHAVFACVLTRCILEKSGRRQVES